MLERRRQHAKRSVMPRTPGPNTFQVAFKIPEAWLEEADAIAQRMTGGEMWGRTITRTDVLRAALFAGLQEMKKMKVKK